MAWLTSADTRKERRKKRERNMTRETETSWGGWRLPRIQISGKTRRKKRKKNDTRLAGVDGVGHVYRSQERQERKKIKKHDRETEKKIERERRYLIKDRLMIPLVLLWIVRVDDVAHVCRYQERQRKKEN